MDTACCLHYSPAQRHTHHPKTLNPIIVSHGGQNKNKNKKKGLFDVGNEQMFVLCGFGYWVQGFRCFPWLALNFHMAHNLSLRPSTLQLVQHSVLLQVLSWGPLALIPAAGKALPSLMACVLLSNMGASITEVAKDALVAEYGQKHGIGGLQSYAFMALAVGGILGNLLGGYCLLKTEPRTMFLIFSLMLSLQFAISLSSREESLGLRSSEENPGRKLISESVRKQLSSLMLAIKEDSILQPLTWIVASIAIVPILSGSVFCYQTQGLHLDPSVFGMSRVIGQVILLCMTVLYDRYWKRLPMRKLIGAVQVLYASSLLLDLVLVRQINVGLGISNELFALCFSGLAETLAQFKLLPFSTLLASLCPKGCEGSLTSFLASALCLSSVISGFLGVGLASLLGITSSDFSSLPVGILIQFLAALVPLVWIHHVPWFKPVVEKERRQGMSRRSRRNRRVGRVVFGSVYVYRRERESEAQR
ncbi:probable folate-biopterin transporter 8, chloroplastic isoform X2 [Carica papaya]|uniref:probable folate-biopterin transporter 8, chloroplastic isoform X2 n=1 Tax=Carica papaya TaxID=3649 RepID=UPI000B8CAECF|nr:probable folate-biopterin transporter 8, chloroplastic isoform X2 [Carica papaya]